MSAATKASTSRRTRDFWIFFTGQSVSNLGTSVTLFALPLLVYNLTGSALNLAFTTVSEFVPYLLFGLVIGAWVDRVNRKRLMIFTDLTRAYIIASIPVAAHLGILTVGWIYIVGFLASTLAIVFNSCEFAAIPSLAGQDDLVTANGRIQASYSTMSVLGPIVAGALVAALPVASFMAFDAISFFLSAITLTLIRASFNTAPGEPKRTHILRDVADGLRYVLRHPVLRNISAMMALVNFFGTTVYTQLVVFAKVRLGADNAQVAWLFAAGSAGVVVLSLLAGLLRKRWTFSRVALGALMLEGIITAIMATQHAYWVALPLWALASGLGILFNINTGSLRQAIVPNELLGRVISIAGVLAWSAIPLGAFLGGFAIEQTGNVALIYFVIGIITFLIPLAFSFTALGHAERYLPKPTAPAGTPEAQRAPVHTA